MADIGTSEQEHREDAGAVLVKRLVLFLRSSLLYAVDHPRVVSAGGRVLESAARLRHADGVVKVQALGKDLHVNGKEVALGEDLLEWIKDGLLHADLAGVELLPGSDLRSLVAFAARFHDASRRSEPLPADYWSRGSGAVRPLDLRIRGTHGPAAEEKAVEETSEDPSWNDTPALTRPLAAGSPQERILAHLSEDPGIQRRSNALVRSMGAAGDGGGECGRIDLVSEIARMLPVEATRDSKVARAMVGKILGALESAQEGRRPEFGEESGPGVGGVALRVARRFFGVLPSPGSAPDESVLHDVAPRSEDGGGSLEDLLSRVEELPSGEGVSLEGEAEKHRDELLGACVHLILTGEQEREAEPGVHGEGEEEGREPETGREAGAVCSRLLALLREPPGQAREILDDCLEPCFADGLERPQESPSWRLFEFLRENRLGGWVRAGRHLARERVVEGFPDRFDLFLETFSPGEPGDVASLTEAIDRLPRCAIESAEAALTGERGILTADRAGLILGLSTPSALPLVRILAAHGDADIRARVALYLRRIDLSTAEAAALRAVDPPGLLPGGYLQGLCGLLISPGDDPRLREYSGFLLRKFIADAANDPDRLERRTYAIRALGALPTPESVQLLRQLSRSGRLLSQGHAARAVRQAASRTLKEIAGAQEGDR